MLLNYEFHISTQQVTVRTWPITEYILDKCSDWNKTYENMNHMLNNQQQTDCIKQPFYTVRQKNNFRKTTS